MFSVCQSIFGELSAKSISCRIYHNGNKSILDQGSQFTSKAYLDCVKSYESIRISMDGKGRATDNIRIERFFRSFKWERLYLLRPETVRELKEMTTEYMAHYNLERDHQGLEYATPYEIYFNSNKLAA